MATRNEDFASNRALQAALRKTTETLARELGCPTETAPEWSEFEWDVARAVAAMHGISPLLSTVLRWKGPTAWNEFLQIQRAHTAARHIRTTELLRLLDRRARADNIPMVALKGAELHNLGLYVPGERPMADIDLLVKPAEVARTARMLVAMGFHESFSTWKHKVFVPHAAPLPQVLGEHADNYLKIELHDSLREALPLNIADVSNCVFSSSPRAGVNGYPSKAALMSHLLLHAAGAMAYRSLRLLNLHDLALLSSSMTNLEWDEFIGQSKRDGGHWWAWPPLQLADRYYPRAIPTGALATLAAQCPPVLRVIERRRRISDVSLSYLRIDAFPGISWSQSASEAARYVMGRIRPDSYILNLRQQALKTQSAIAASPWHHLSQGRRVIRWLLSRPARAETLHAIHLALSPTA